MTSSFSSEEMSAIKREVKSFLSRETLQCHFVRRPCNYVIDMDNYRMHLRKTPVPAYGRYDLREGIVEMISDDPAEPCVRSAAFRRWLGFELAAYKRELEGRSTPSPSSETSAVMTLMEAMGGSPAEGPERGASDREYCLGHWCKANFKKDVEGVSVKISSVNLTEEELFMLFQGITQVQEMVLESSSAVNSRVASISYGKGLQVKPAKSATRTSKDVAFEPSLVNTKPTAELFIDRLDAILSKPKHEQPSSITCLFHGAPGTSKTALGQHLADRLELPLMKRNFADIQDKYVGEGEKKLAQIFDEAYTTGSILLIDEVDSIAANRFTAEKEHVKTMTNQLLTSLDDHEGIVICTTNFLKSLDPAVLRRFYLKMKFDYLTPEQQQIALRKFFPRRFRNKDMPAINYLTTGDFKVIKEKSLYEPKTPTFERVIEMLKEEVELKVKATPELHQATKRSIGFH